jgi:putative intracellular protease/amidase
MHPWFEFLEAGFDLELASIPGGPVSIGPLSHPLHEGRMMAGDVISLGYLNTPDFMEQLKSSKKLSACEAEAYDAVYVAGGIGPMFQFRENIGLQALLRDFYEANKVTSLILPRCLRTPRHQALFGRFSDYRKDNNRRGEYRGG